MSAGNIPTKRPYPIVRRSDEPDLDPTHNPWVNGLPLEETLEIVPYDARWPGRYAELAAEIRGVLGKRALVVDHIGSTAVPGMAAKNIIDIQLAVADPVEEASYVPALGDIGYVLTIREPWWHQHRCLWLEQPRVHLHVFGPDCPELIGHRMFCDWLSTHPSDRELYEQAKRAAVPDGGRGYDVDYSYRKSSVIRQIYNRLFGAAGML